MVFLGQTLKHKTKNILVRVAPRTPNNDQSANLKIKFVDKEGNCFQDILSEYTHIEDEFGRPYVKLPRNGQFVDESAEKYLCSEKEMLKMRKRSLLEWEERVLERMAGVHCKDYDIPRKIVSNPFADGSVNHMAEAFFLKRRKAIPLIVTWTKSYRKDKKDGFSPDHATMCFYHTDHKMWLCDIYDLKVIDVKALKKVLGLIKP